MQKRNKYDLARHISEPVKRAVRRACGFGCVVCGTPFIQYHHSDVAYADAKIHDPAKITLLCGTCHDRVTRGTYSNEKIEEHVAHPYCLENGPAYTDIDYGRDAPNIRFAGSEFENCMFPVRIHDYGLITLQKPVEQGSPVLLSALFTNSQGNVSVVIDRNNVLLMPANWDVTTEGTRVRVWDAARKPSLTLNIVPRTLLEIERIESSFLGWSISGDTKEFRVTQPGAKGPNTFSGIRMGGGHIGFQFGKSNLR